ncbi:MAG: lysine--tRNA ligase [Candidatus Binatia bacterium]
MLWCDQLASKIEGRQIINDSKTPSGRVHVGALRGVLIHEAMFRTLKERGLPVRYIFGVDDYDPLDELPAGDNQQWKQHLGKPLCNVPPPPGSEAPDIAEHYIREFFDIFRELGVYAETYRMRDIYRSGQFNEVIDAILRNAATVRRIYKEVSNSQRSETWHPFQVMCEQCGRIGTTEVTAYDSQEVVYTCRPNLVTWARGCDYKGKVSPFNGRGKLPWKLEWTAKWKTFQITLEGAGKDHNTKGGSRDVAAQCLREIFGQEPPLNIPYEFFLVGGAKMSSSRGVGAAARNIADFLPPDVLRFLLIRTQPQQPVNFSPDEKYIIKLFNDFDRYHWRTYHDPKVTEDERRVYQLSEIAPEGDFYDVNFQLVLTLVQMPHLDLAREVEKRKGAALSPTEYKHLEQRVRAARYWLDHHARPEERIVVQDSLPQRAHELTASQRAYLHQLAAKLPTTPWEDDALQSQIFTVTRLTPVTQPQAFQAIYRVLLDRDSGPKAGNLLAFLDPEFVVKRLQELPYSQEAFWQETGITPETFEHWLSENKVHITAISAHVALTASSSQRAGAIEFLVSLDDSKTYMKRILLGNAEEVASKGEERRNSATDGHRYIEQVSQKYQLPATSLSAES